jgi:hypothetical protein
MLSAIGLVEILVNDEAVQNFYQKKFELP